MTTVLGFATTTPEIPVTVDIFVMRNVKSDDSSTFRDDFRLSGMSDPTRTLADACERLRTLANAFERLRTLADALRTQRNDLASPPGPLDPNFKTGTLLLRNHSGKNTVQKQQQKQFSVTLRFGEVDQTLCSH